MKKILMTLVAVAMATTMNAQWYIGGEVGFNTTTNTVKINGVSTDETTNNFTIAPEVGYNLSDKWAVAMKIGFAHSGNNGEVAVLLNNYLGALGFKDGKVTTNAIVINPYVRYTFVKSGNFSAFVDGGIGYISTHVNGTSDFLNNINQIKVGINPGVAYAISPKVSLVAHLGDLSYQNTWCKVKEIDAFDFDYKVSQGKFIIGLWNSISFGAYYNF
jgi:hypothetical protein